MTATIFLDMKKDCEKVDREKTFEELENMGIQGRSLDFRELFCERWIKVRVSGSILQSTNTDLGIPQGGIFKSTVGSDQQVGYVDNKEGTDLLPQQNSKHYIWRRKRNEVATEIMLRNQLYLIKYLVSGMTLDSRLNWEEHINKLRAKAKRTLKL